MKTLEIEIPQGFEVESFDKQKDKVKIKFKEQPKDVMDRIKYLDDAIGELGDADPEVIRLKKLLSIFDKDDSVVGFQAAVVIARALNEKWVPNWEDSNYKYWPWFYMGGSSGFRFYDFAGRNSLSSVGSRLCFKSRELAEYAAKQFTPFYKQFMTL